MKLFVFFPFLFLPIFCFSQISEKFDDELISSAFEQPVGVVLDPEGRILVWEKFGVVKMYDEILGGSPKTILDISEKVASWGDQGMMCVTLDPDYMFNRYVYIAYAVDRYYLENHMKTDYNPDSTIIKQATIGRISRFTMNSSFDEIDPNSEFVIIGHDFSDGVPISADFHGLGSIVFGDDGSLLISVGDGGNDEEDAEDQDNFYADQAIEDGIMVEKEFVGPFRAQLLDNLNGKILRVNPLTGFGYPSNPFYDETRPESNISRIYALGLRNSFSFVKVPHTGSISTESGFPGVLFSGDVGAGTWEELNLVDRPGLNFGWPSYEGFHTQWPYHYQLFHENQDAPNPIGTLCNKEFFNFQDLISNVKLDSIYFFANPCDNTQEIPANIHTFIHQPPVIVWSNKLWNSPDRAMVLSLASETNEITDQPAIEVGITAENFSGYSSIPGFWYESGLFPDSLNHSLFLSDFSGWIKAFTFDENFHLQKVTPIVDDVKGIVKTAFDAETGSIYYVNIEKHQLRRLLYEGNPKPVAVIDLDQNYGSSPLEVQLSGVGSYDPKGENIQYLWDFGDGTSSDKVNVNHVFASNDGLPKVFEVSLQVTDEIGQKSLETQIISVNNTPPSTKILGVNNGDNYSIAGRNYLSLSALSNDIEQEASTLNHKWEIFLHHNFHFHAEQPLFGQEIIAITEPLGCDGEDYWYRIKLTATDDFGLYSEDELEIFPNCNDPFIKIHWKPELLDDKSITLHWQCEDAFTGSMFIERFDYLGNFKVVGQIENINNQLEFNWTDKSPLIGKNNYRIRAINSSGLYEYSGLHAVQFPYEPYIKIFPNPVRDRLVLHLDASVWKDLILQIYDDKMSLIQERVLAPTQVKSTIEFQVTDLVPGSYYLHVLLNDQFFIREFQKF